MYIVHMSIKLIPSLRVALTRLRVGCHRLLIEVGRYHALPICNTCGNAAAASCRSVPRKSGTIGGGSNVNGISARYLDLYSITTYLKAQHTLPLIRKAELFNDAFISCYYGDWHSIE